MYPGQLAAIAGRLQAFCAGAGRCSLLYALTSAMLCDTRANDNVAGLNAEARAIMEKEGIPTVDLQAAIVGKCVPAGQRLPVDSCFNIR